MATTRAGSSGVNRDRERKAKQFTVFLWSGPRSVQLVLAIRFRRRSATAGAAAREARGEGGTFLGPGGAWGPELQGRGVRFEGRCGRSRDALTSLCEGAREMSLSGRDSLPQEGAPGSGERRNTRVKRAVRISSIVAQEVSLTVSEAPPNTAVTQHTPHTNSCLAL